MKKKKVINVICVNNFPHSAYEDIHEGELARINLQIKFDREDEQKFCRKRHVYTKIISLK